MTRRGQLVGGSLVAVVALSLGACASTPATAKVSSKALCENAGGKYASGTCTPGTARKADAMCEGFGGIFVVDEDLCHIPTR